MAKKAAPESVEVSYDLFDLPTAQHKAGLAGLILAIRSLKERSEKDPEAIPPASVPEIIDGPDNTSIKIRFTERSVKGLFDDLYDADLIKSEPREKPRTKGKGASKTVIPPIERAPMRFVDKKTGKEKEVEGYVYLDVTPRLASLSPLLPPMPLWLKLWRNVLFQAIRDGRKQAPYKKRSAERFKNSPLADAVVGSEEEPDSVDDESGGSGEGSNWDAFAKGRQEKLS
jgi:CRISPR-associated protein Cmx8